MEEQPQKVENGKNYSRCRWVFCHQATRSSVYSVERLLPVGIPYEKRVAVVSTMEIGSSSDGQVSQPQDNFGG